MKDSTGGWNDALFSSVMIVSFCMRVMELHVYVVVVITIFRIAFAQDTQAPSQASWCGGVINYNSQSHLVFLQGEVNSVHYIAQVVNTVLLPFL